MSRTVEKNLWRIWHKSVQQYLDVKTVILLTEAAVLPVVAITPETAWSAVIHGCHKVVLTPVKFVDSLQSKTFFILIFIHLHIYTF